MERFLLLAIFAVITAIPGFQVARADEAAQLKVTVTGSTDCKAPVWPADNSSHVVLKLLVAADGSVLKGDIATSSGQPNLDRLALEAYSHCHFGTNPIQKEPTFIFYTFPSQEKRPSGAAWLPEDIWNAETRGDWSMVVKLLRPLAEGGDAKAQSSLGVEYEIGRGVPVDYAEALKWLQKAADQGNAEAQVNLAGMYRLGRGVPQSDAEGLKWLLKSAAQRNPGAFINLGHVYRNGNGVPVDLVQAYMWYRLASDAATHPSARQAADQQLANLASKITPQQIAEAERRARDWKP